jgi:hypothetical protein
LFAARFKRTDTGELASQPREHALEVSAKLRERALKLFDAEKIERYNEI